MTCQGAVSEGHERGMQQAAHLVSCRQGESAIMMEQSFAVMATRYC